MVATVLSPILHAVIALALLAAYVTLQVLGHDDQVLLGILGGQLGGLGVSQIAQQAAAAAPAKTAAQPVAPLPPTG